jgi:hypothetical protein
MRRLATVGVFVVVLGVASGFVWWRLEAGDPSAHAAILFDASGSQLRTCDAAKGLAIRAIDFIAHAPSPSLELFVIGDGESANEPRQLPLPLPPSTPKRVLSGRGTADDGSRSLPETVRTHCQELAPTNSSPIYLALRQVVAYVAGQGDSVSRRQVFVRSDLQETVERAIRKALLQPKGSSLDGLPPPIDNRIVAVSICGYAETQGNVRGPKSRTTYTRPRTADSAERLTEVWTALFVRKETLALAPFCQSPRAPLTDDAGSRTQ